MSTSAKRAELAENDCEHYLSVRVTCSHVDVRQMLESIFKDAEYICYRHKGTKTGKEHVHVLVPDVTLQTKLKDRLRFAGYKGNETYSIKAMHNWLHAGIQYCAKEGGLPLSNGNFDELIEASPKWVQKDVYSYMHRDSADVKKLRDWQLSYTNIVPVTVRYVQDKGLTSLSFFDAIDHLMEHTNWRICDKIQRMGIGPFQISDYERRLGKAEAFDKSWRSNWRV